MNYIIALVAMLSVGVGCAGIPPKQSNPALDAAMKPYCGGRGYIVTSSGSNVFIPSQQGYTGDPRVSSLVYTESAILVCR